MRAPDDPLFMIILGGVILFWCAIAACCAYADHRERSQRNERMRVEALVQLYAFAEQVRRA